MKSLHRSALVALALLTMASFTASCGKKADEAASSAVSDSLLSAAPAETPEGGVQPTDGLAAGDSAVAEVATPAPAAETPASKPAAKPVKKPAAPKAPAAAASTTVPAGTSLKIKVDTALNSETAQAGQSWAGTITEAIVVGSAAPFPAGSVVHGVVDGVMPAEKGARAFLVLRVTSIEANGASHEISAHADSIIAGSTRKRNVGAVAGGAAAGALLGKAIGGSGKGAVIGGILGGAAATGAVAASKGFQVDIPAGKEMVFRVGSDTKVKL